jgi:cytochrome c oxidase subunit 2
LSPTLKPERRAASRTARLGLFAALPTILLTSGCDLKDAGETALRVGIPKPVTVQGEHIYHLWLGSVGAATAVGVFVWALIFWAGFHYRKNSDELPRQVRYNLPIEVLYTIVPFVIISVLFYYTAVTENFVDKAEKPDLRVNIVGFQWNWQFVYPEQKVQVTGSPTQPAMMVLPADERIRFVESSPDVIHAWWVPEFLFKRDVIPGRFNTFDINIRSKAIGHTYVGRCTEYCGEKHDRMNFFVKIVSKADFDAYMAKLQGDPNAQMGTATAAIPTGDQGSTSDQQNASEK